jgi:gluconolactonase
VKAVRIVVLAILLSAATPGSSAGTRAAAKWRLPAGYAPAQSAPTQGASVVAPGAEIERLATGFRFTEGPSAEADGGLWFTDVFDPGDAFFEGEIYHWTPSAGATLYRGHTNRTNGTGWFPGGGLVGCEWFGRRLVHDNLAGNVTTLVDSYDGLRLNGPNDVWVAPDGSIYFTDPVFGPPPGEIELPGQYIYRLPVHGGELERVSDALQLPNGLVGTPDMKWLYVTESGGSTYRYAIASDGSLTGKTFYAPRSGDGMTLDADGNVYVADDYDVWVYDPAGRLLERIRPPEPPSNVTFGGQDGRTLFITAYTSVYGLAMAVAGAYPPGGTTDVVPPGAEVERLATGFTFTEGPAVDQSGDVYFSDVPQSKIHRYRPGGDVSVYRSGTARANGLYFDGEWRMAVCEAAGQRVVLDDRSGTIQPIADAYGGRPFNAPNDLWIAPDGGVYFTDPLFTSPGPSNQGVSRAYYVPPGGGEPVAVLDDLGLPNGLIGTPDGQTLYVADYASDGKVWRYHVDPDGTLSGKTAFANRRGDGMTLDERGNVYVASGARVWIYRPDGTELQSIEVPETPSNVTFGGPEGRTLYITATSSLYAIRLNVRGAFARTPAASPTPTATEPTPPRSTPTPTSVPTPPALYCPTVLRAPI